MKKRKEEKIKGRMRTKIKQLLKLELLIIKKKNPKAHAQLANRHFCPLNTY